MIKQVVFEYEEFEHKNQLSIIHQELIEKARQAIEDAYAPYSKFYVGASVLLENGQIITGNNQENVAFPSGLCAERVALFFASSQFPDVPIRALAIAAKSDTLNIHQIITPCGACRQVMVEYELKQQKPFEILLVSGSGRVCLINNAQSLLPLLFNASLKK
jgi:cytidine deaminase